jgi:hypothetical protein
MPARNGIPAAAVSEGANQNDNQESTMISRISPVLGAVAAAAFLSACGGDDDMKAGATAQTPPMGAASLEAWLAQKHHQSWRCETAPQDGQPPSPHGRKRICSNSVLSAHGSGEYPVGAAAVKELYDGSGAIAGYAVSHHIRAGKDAGSWYWYKRPPGMGVVADGTGDSGSAKDVCVGCHMAAGSDAAHPGHDFVYIQVK